MTEASQAETTLQVLTPTEVASWIPTKEPLKGTLQASLKGSPYKEALEQPVELTWALKSHTLAGFSGLGFTCLGLRGLGFRV